MKGIRVHVHKDKCVGSTTCIHIAPGHFKLAEDGQAVFIPSGRPLIDLIIEAAENCPVGAIEIEE